MVGGQIGPRFHLSTRPHDFYLVDLFAFTQAEVKTKVILRQVAPTTHYFSKLHHVSRGHLYTRIQRETIALHPLQLKADPVVLRAALRTKDHRFAHEIFNYHFEFAVVEKVAHRHAAAHLGNLDCSSSLCADVFESPIALIHEQQLRLGVSDLG